MAVATYLQPNYNTQTGTDYPLTIDGDFSVNARIAAQFAPHEQASPNMTVRVDAGHIYNALTNTLTEVSGQNTGTITAPVGNPRYDIVYIDRISGSVGVATGTPAASPAYPAIPAGKVPVAAVLLQTSSTTITNSMITDIRDLNSLGIGDTAFYQVGEVSGTLPLWQNTRWNKASFSQKTTNYTVVAGDRGSIILANGAGITINMNATALGDGFVIGVTGGDYNQSFTVGDNAASNNFYGAGYQGVETIVFSGRGIHWFYSQSGVWFEMANSVLDIPSLTAEAAPVTSDYIAMWDTSATQYRKVLLSSLASLFATSGALLGVKAFTSTGTYTKTAGTNNIIVIVVGGGGNGGNASGEGGEDPQGSSAGGGGGGGCAIKFISGGVSSITVTVGGAGGTSSFGGYCSATGGAHAANAASASTTAGGAAGVGSGGDLNFQGDDGATGVDQGTAGGQGGGSFLGGGGQGRGGGSAQTGNNYGGGGGGACHFGNSSTAGAAGAGGCVLVLEFA